MAYIKADIQVWRGNTGTATNRKGFVVRDTDSNGVHIIPDSARFMTKCGTIDKDSITGDILLNQDVDFNGTIESGCTVVPFSPAETRALDSSKYELEYTTGTSQTTMYYGSIKASGGLNID